MISKKNIIDFANSSDTCTISFDDFKKSLNKGTVTSKGGQAALSGLALAGNIVVGMLVSLGVQAIFEEINN